MADKEILKNDELDAVTGGSGIECIALLSRLQTEGLYTPKTSLTPGNEAAAAAELKAYLGSLKNPRTGEPAFAFSEIYSDGRANDYKVVSVTGQNGEIVGFHHFDVDGLVGAIRYIQGK